MELPPVGEFCIVNFELKIRELAFIEIRSII